MATVKPSLAKGTRDFSPAEMLKRNYIFNTLKRVFKKYGYSEIQTPSFENLQTLTGKYGDEGDQLIFKILNSGDYLSKAPNDLLESKSSTKLISLISEKALRYDLTVPFARYVVMHQNDISLPFKRFQIQPVWRADRPQRGRYREFYQCDVDVVGSESLLNEAEFILIYHEALKNLGLQDFTIKINNRKILSGIAEIIGKPELIVDMTVAIDKLDKIGLEGVNKELLERGFTAADLEILRPIILLEGSNLKKLSALKHVLSNSEIGLKGIAEIEESFDYISKLDSSNEVLNQFVEVDITLARGLNYYTGCIFEVKTNEVAMGSIGGGGRYDDLTGMFGLKGLTGVGVSFGADRIYDVLEELNLYPEAKGDYTKLLIVNFDKETESFTLPLLNRLRKANIAVELYPTAAKLKKQMSYADSKGIPFVLLIGEEEVSSGQLSLKDMQTGDQRKIDESSLIVELS
ncbi:MULTISPECIES: histidine--tRNA ligase [Sphingobacterium]|uniref:Histidine--tRNA ligase n=1 Tax=Sphingobacterium kitahiroshimense TaxID=470446 RepID=A0ABV0BTY5_9SPHI|nr:MULTISPECIES: histidine--tRNA ligase [Sphingobacterium]MBB2953086.1 histidyl-tRNA synthetase [Sphingobacterium sp. JUb56]MCS3555190.1 histidyl-tRNA synthetase [Sphingobacterium sp. JUb21]MCW2261529.1 histidyl-tRNA synthetase [Sphingobacterium kitahiroshimense]QQD14820.1 histidine--tRNA ligase [Sphingobacterium sp. UDSM-2020]TCR03663.1 histidyl-tRNA synthetase [Sphingobacterium sp. JUb20]